MSKIWAWVLGLVVLVAIGFLLACGTTYNASSDGLVLVTSQGSGLIETFTFTLASGHVATNQNSPFDTANQTCVLNGIPSSIVVDPAGAYAYAVLTGNSQCQAGSGGTTSGSSNSPLPAYQPEIVSYKINSDGSTTQVGTPIIDPNPVELVMDSTGKFLFVAEGNLQYATQNGGKFSAPCSPASGVCVYAIGSGGSLTLVSGSVPLPAALQPSTISAIAVSHLVQPALLFGQSQSVCSLPNPPLTSEFLYAVDSTNYAVWEFSVNTSTGVLGPPTSVVPSFPTGSTPMGVAVDPCNRFVYVSNNISNTVSGYTICNGISTTPLCTAADGTLNPIPGPNSSNSFPLANGAQGPGPLVVDPYGNNVYVLDTTSNTISPFKISPAGGALTAMNPATVATGVGATWIVIRPDDNWMFVTDYIAATVSQYAIAPATGALSPQLPISTDNYPWGVAVK